MLFRGPKGWLPGSHPEEGPTAPTTAGRGNALFRQPSDQSIGHEVYSTAWDWRFELDVFCAAGLGG
jgi:hypothetical protein